MPKVNFTEIELFSVIEISPLTKIEFFNEQYDELSNIRYVELTNTENEKFKINKNEFSKLLYALSKAIYHDTYSNGADITNSPSLSKEPETSL